MSELPLPDPVEPPPPEVDPAEARRARRRVWWLFLGLILGNVAFLAWILFGRRG